MREHYIWPLTNCSALRLSPLNVIPEVSGFVMVPCWYAISYHLCSVVIAINTPLWKINLVLKVVSEAEVIPKLLRSVFWGEVIPLN